MFPAVKTTRCAAELRVVTTRTRDEGTKACLTRPKKALSPSRRASPRCVIFFFIVFERPLGAREVATASMGAFDVRVRHALGWALTSMARANFGEGWTRRVSGDRMREGVERMEMNFLNASDRCLRVGRRRDAAPGALVERRSKVVVLVFFYTSRCF